MNVAAWTHRWDLCALALLALLSAAWLLAAFHEGLDSTPDSGLYLYCGALAHLGDPLSASPSSYAPGFPWLIAAMLNVVAIPGDAGTLVQGLSVLSLMLGAYVALRALGAPPIFCLCAALLLRFCRSTAYVFEIQLSEGPMCGALTLLVAIWAVWRVRPNLAGSIALILLGSLVPFIKYAAAVVPLIVALFWALFHPAPSTYVRRALRFVGAAALGLAPILAYLAYNRVRDGAITDHPASRTGLLENAMTAWQTVADVWRGRPLTFLLLGSAVILVALLKPRARAALRLDVFFFCAALAAGFFVAIVAGASLVHVDPLSMRLSAPGIALSVLTLAIAVTCALQALEVAAPSWLRGLRVLHVLVALLALHAVLPRVRGAFVRPTRALFPKPGKDSVLSAYQGGFRSTTGARSLSAFYAQELATKRQLSVTLLEIRSQPGRIRRSWITVAGALGSTPSRFAGLGKLELAAIDENATRFELADGGQSLLFLAAGLPDRAAIPDLSSLQDERLSERIAVTVALVLDSARSIARPEHWLLVAKTGDWFVPSAGKLGGAEVLRELDVGSYIAYLLKT